ncbi:MAG: UDP-N-acetylmuramoyl-L-alanine--D-glutamate ligase [Clostridiales bacterium]|nr:UDP-N-acetylmuramoyl-L-alanine--D-glutamate ligase [Candidatus Crickella caballi]
MNYREILKNKRILVVGLGKSGKAAVEALQEIGAKLSVQDNSSAEKIDAQFIRFMEENDIEMYLGAEPEDMSSWDMLVLSPGVPTDRAFVQAARAAGAEIIGELELAYRLSAAKYVAITGTNGKTTTTTLVGEIFKASGRITAVVGNIGNPVVTEAMDSDSDKWMVAEVSSFQLETTSEFHPVVSAILNLTPDHLNRHKTMEAYGAAKASVFAQQDEGEYLVINYDDKLCYSLAADCKAVQVPFSRLEILEFGAYLDGDELLINDGKEIISICRKQDLKIIGNHNIENALAAAAICYFAGIEAEIISEAIKAFPGVEHRIEYCGELDGAAYYNDSKGTNVDASIIAVKALENNIILIAGGDGKSQDFTELAEHLTGPVKALVLLGRDAPIIEEAARKAGFENIYTEKDMEGVLRKCRSLAEAGDKVLLSPACASWDMYDNFEQRGRHFKECLAEMRK